MVYLGTIFFPLVAQGIIIFLAEKSYSTFYNSICMAIPYLVCLFAWWLYLENIFSIWLSWLCIGISSWAMGTMFFTIWATIRSKSYNNQIGNKKGFLKFCTKFCIRLGEEIGKKNFIMICIFLLAFISVTYLLSFALAFHDREERIKGKRALHYQGLGEHLEGIVFKDLEEKTPTEAPSPYLGKVLFDQGSAIVNENEKENKNVIDNLIKEAKNISNQHGYRYIRIVLIGHCSIEPVAEGSKKYSSNYELSEARARQVKWMLLKKLEQEIREIYEYNVEWEILPMSHEEAEKEKSDSKYNPKQWRSVGVYIYKISPKRRPLTPSLLDYIYFTIYTITTTGYGDIMPVTSHAKFITSIANIFEVFFIVIFFNALFTLGGKQQQ